MVLSNCSGNVGVAGSSVQPSPKLLGAAETTPSNAVWLRMVVILSCMVAIKSVLGCCMVVWSVGASSRGCEVAAAAAADDDDDGAAAADEAADGAAAQRAATGAAACPPSVAMAVLRFNLVFGDIVAMALSSGAQPPSSSCGVAGAQPPSSTCHQTHPPEAALGGACYGARDGHKSRGVTAPRALQ